VSIASPSAIVYVDVARLVEGIRQSPFGSLSGRGVDEATYANLAPLRATMLTSASRADRAVERFFVIIR
jgi:hypothetical protein